VWKSRIVKITNNPKKKNRTIFVIPVAVPTNPANPMIPMIAATNINIVRKISTETPFLKMAHMPLRLHDNHHAILNVMGKRLLTKKYR
jgi:hypothetical protein